MLLLQCSTPHLELLLCWWLLDVLDAVADGERDLGTMAPAGPRQLLQLLIH
jgi:hypothetical protein